MRLKVLFSILVCLVMQSALTAAQETKAYKLQIGNISVDIDVDETIELKLPDGSTTNVKLSRNEFAAYVAAGFSFIHPSDVSVSESDIGDGITQHLMATARGTIVIVQEYTSVDPSSLTQFMLQEMTKEAVAAGAQVTQQPATRKTPSGKTLSGLKAVEAGRTDTADYEVLTYGNSGAGLLVVTRLDREFAATDRAMLAKFWETFDLK